MVTKNHPGINICDYGLQFFLFCIEFKFVEKKIHVVISGKGNYNQGHIKDGGELNFLFIAPKKRNDKPFNSPLIYISG